jgi:Cys-tRNA synthase (O-phospho-L-seryl-tRNA:Cys-tRNA synthase)
VDFEDTLKKSAAALREADIPYLLAGSFALWARGLHARRNDIDFVVRPGDAGAAVEALVAAGMREAETPEEWLRKVYDGEVLVDVIFDPAGLPVDEDVVERGDDVEVAGMTFRVMALEDVMTTKLFAFKEHYLDYESVLEMARTLRDQVEWDELRRRCEGYPYAQPFFTLIEELGVIPRADGTVVEGERVSQAQISRHADQV